MSYFRYVLRLFSSLFFVLSGVASFAEPVKDVQSSPSRGVETETRAEPLDFSTKGPSRGVINLIKERRQEAMPSGEFERIMESIQKENLPAVGDSDFVTEFIKLSMSEIVKHELDRSVSRVLHKDPTAQELTPQVGKMVEEFLFKYYLAHMGSAPPALDTNEFADLKLMASFAGELLGFSEEVYKSPQVFTINSNQVNAYTWSGTSKAIQMAFFRGLLNDPNASPEAVLAIIGHEIGHIRAGHIYNSVMLNVIFLIAGEILIPNLAEERLRLEVEAQWDDELSTEQAQEERFNEIYEHLMDLFGESLFGFWQDSLIVCESCQTQESRNNGIKTIGDSIPKEFSQTISSVASMLSEEYIEKSDEGIYRLVLNIANTLSDEMSPKGRLEDQQMLEDLDLFFSEDGRGISSLEEWDKAENSWFRSLKRLSKKMNKLNRSQEITADRYAVLVAGLDAVVRSEALLLGTFDEATIHYMADSVAKIYAENPYLASKVAQTTHPDTIFRPLANKRFTESYEYRLRTEPLMLNLYVYARLVMEADKNSLLGRLDSTEAREGAVRDRKRAHLEFAASKFQESIFAEIKGEIDTLVKELKAGETELALSGPIASVLEFLGNFNERPEEGIDPRKLGKPDRLLDKVIGYLEEKRSVKSVGDNVRAVMGEFIRIFSSYSSPDNYENPDFMEESAFVVEEASDFFDELRVKGKQNQQEDTASVPHQSSRRRPPIRVIKKETPARACRSIIK